MTYLAAALIMVLLAACVLYMACMLFNARLRIALLESKMKTVTAYVDGLLVTSKDHGSRIDDLSAVASISHYKEDAEESE